MGGLYSHCPCDPVPPEEEKLKVPKQVNPGEITIDCVFAGGNIQHNRNEELKPQDIKLGLEKDPVSRKGQIAHSGWFYFQVSNCFEKELTLNIDLGKGAPKKLFDGYSAFVSSEFGSWESAPSEYDEEKKTLSIQTKPATYGVSVAYFPPYGYDRELQDFLNKAQKKEGCSHEVIGKTTEGRNISMLRLGSGKFVIWIVARQHPSETQGSWWVEGFVNEMLDAPKVYEDFLKNVTICVVPCMNPDGCVLGHTVTNKAGIDLMYEWSDSKLNKRVYKAPTAKNSNEVFCVLEMMEKLGCDFFMDIRGRFEHACCFLQAESNWIDEQIDIFNSARKQLEAKLSGEFHEDIVDKDSKGGVSTNEKTDAQCKSRPVPSVMEKFKDRNCFGVTLNMPFKKINHSECMDIGAKCVIVVKDLKDTIDRANEKAAKRANEKASQKNPDESPKEAEKVKE